MTQDLSHCTELIKNCTEQLWSFKQNVINKTVLNGSSTEDLNTWRAIDCNLFGDAINKLSQIVETVKKTADEPLKTGIANQFNNLQAQYENLKGRLNSEAASQTCQVTDTFNALKRQFQEALKEGEEGFQKIEILKNRNRVVLATSGLTAHQFNEGTKLDFSIEKQQNLWIGGMLHEIDSLINAIHFLPEENTNTQQINSISKLLYDKLRFSQMGYKVQQQIFEQIWIEAGKPPGDDNWGGNHALDDFVRLSNVIRQQAQYKAWQPPYLNRSFETHDLTSAAHVSVDALYEILNSHVPDVYSNIFP